MYVFQKSKNEAISRKLTNVTEEMIKIEQERTHYYWHFSKINISETK